ncbi:M23 family metallopeptidase [filamentous cyanobacterium LEGE 11480]|uniref:M23 family metallopeptidase n=1 Tax=Romeriopsis navalis LEGE 11480 TaxID=2777977 RepID=A0A928VK07_9CYAN|nr:M23 family metallopeptidase [Romeriopsis navalis]MBE9030028.1 M23 family metallopeptidase [Romeriopsis navalis LEGE 11480]
MSLLFAVPIVAGSAAPSSAVKMVENIPVPAPIQRWSPATSRSPATTPKFSPYHRLLPQPRRPQAPWRYPIAHAGTITSNFGWRIHPISGGRRFHAGLDIAAPTGTPVVATTGAKVKSAGRKGGYGLTIVLQHWDGRTQTLYGHLSKILVKPGQRIQSGQVIGQVGSTGRSTGPHLHFEVRRRKRGKWLAVNPHPLLKKAIDRRKLAQQ